MRFLIVLILVFMVGCTSYTAPLYKMGDLETDRKASSMPNSKPLKGMIVGAKLYADSKFCQKFFGFDLVGDGLIPVLVAFENEPNNNAFDIFPDKMTLTILSGTKQIQLKAISITKCGYSLDVEKDVEPKIFPEWRVTENSKKNGFVLFDMREYGWGEEELSKLLKNSLLEIQVTKNKLEKKPKEGEDPAKYRGENLSLQILFE